MRLVPQQLCGKKYQKAILFHNSKLSEANLSLAPRPILSIGNCSCTHPERSYQGNIKYDTVCIQSLNWHIINIINISMLIVNIEILFIVIIQPEAVHGRW